MNWRKQLLGRYNKVAIEKKQRRVLDWKSEADNAGPFAPLPVLQKILRKAPPEARSTEEFRLLNRIVDERDWMEGPPIAERKNRLKLPFYVRGWRWPWQREEKA